MQGQDVFFQISIIASFVAGMVALFAPCCITYLLPAYLGNVFKERKNVLFMTLVYSLGIFTIMMPIVLGARVLSELFFDLHDYTYIFGSIFMFFVGIISFLGVKLPMPNLVTTKKLGNDVATTYVLGIFSGITSACCAPVLIGVLALSSLSPTIGLSLLVGAFYVLGMVTPLYLSSLFIHKKNILEKPIFKKLLFIVKLGNREYPVFVSNVIASAMFILTSIVMFILAVSGGLGMESEDGITKLINAVSFGVTDYLGSGFIVNFLFVVVSIYLMYRFIKLSMNKNKAKASTEHFTCPMHPEIIKDESGKCPKCGMSLVKK